MANHSSHCVVLVPYLNHIDPLCEEGLRQLEQRGYPIKRLQVRSPWDTPRNIIASIALDEGFEELVWIDSDIGFVADDVDCLRSRGHALAVGLVPEPGRREFRCEFLSTTQSITFAKDAKPMAVRYASLGFAVVHRALFDVMAHQYDMPICTTEQGESYRPWFMPLVNQDGGQTRYLPSDYAFCERARHCGYEIMADPSIRLSVRGLHSFSWEEAGSDLKRFARYVFQLNPSSEPPATPTVPIKSLRSPAQRLPEGFPRIQAYSVTYQKNLASMKQTQASIQASDWGDYLHVFVQPAEWPVGLQSAARNVKRMLEAAVADGCDFALFLEDDVCVGRHLRHNLMSIPLVRRDQCDYLGLYIPDLIAAPWERCEAHLGYRKAKPLYTGPNKMWAKHRLWGSQGILLSRRFLLAAIECWETFERGIDTRILAICRKFRLSMWYAQPCLIDHAILESAHDTPPARAPDFDPEFRMELGDGFEPPEEIPGWLTREEGHLLWQISAGLGVLELGTAAGRSTVCLGQSATKVVSIDRSEQSEAAEWCRRYGLCDRVVFHQGDVAAVCSGLNETFGLVFIDTGHDAASVTRDINVALSLLEPGGRLAFHDYPDPGWPDVRRVVDDHAHRLGWKRIAQAGYIGIFQT